MSQLAITLTVGSTTLDLDPDLAWTDEFAWHRVEQAVDRSLSGALIVDEQIRDDAGRPITLAPPDSNAAWMTRAVLEQLVAWESMPATVLTLDLRGETYQVIFRRYDAEPIDATPTVFVSDPIAGEIGDWYLVTLRLMVIA